MIINTNYYFGNELLEFLKALKDSVEHIKLSNYGYELDRVELHRESTQNVNYITVTLSYNMRYGGLTRDALNPIDFIDIFQSLPFPGNPEVWNPHCRRMGAHLVFTLERTTK
jgi:hypothetical protein